MTVPRQARAVDAEAGGDERLERLGLARGAAVPVEDVETTHRAHRERSLHRGLERADGAREVDGLIALGEALVRDRVEPGVA